MVPTRASRGLPTESILAQARRARAPRRQNGLTHELAALEMKRQPEMLRFHEMASGFGLGKFAIGVAEDPGSRFARRAASG